MKFFNKFKLPAVLVICMISMNGCTKLDETIYSDLSAGNFYNTKLEVQQSVIRPYSHNRAMILGGDIFWRIGELSGDQMAWPQKGKNGYDSGNWFRLHYHTWTDQETTIRDSWTVGWQGIGYCNATLDDFDKGRVRFAELGITDAEKNAYTAELKVFRAWFYLKLMDYFGNIPIVTTVGEPLSPPTRSRAEVFNFIEGELKANVDNLPNLAPANIGRITKAAGYSMLAELYLNAEKWAGKPKWDDCIAACDKVINGQAGGQNGTPAFDDDISKAFSTTNELSKENLWSLSYDNQLGGQVPSNLALVFFHAKQFEIEGTQSLAGYNGVVIIPTAYDAYSDDDLRKSEWMRIGPQYKLGTTTPVLGTEEYANKPLVFVKEIRRNSEGKTQSDMSQGDENSGARIRKYRFGVQTAINGFPADPKYYSNDWVIYRLAELYFDKAEAIMRKNGNVADQQALDLVNKVRKRAFTDSKWAANAYTIATLNMDELLAERGRELIQEGKRRTDLIRFNKFATGSWWDHKPSAPNKELFPIPYTALQANINLKQNPGY